MSRIDAFGIYERYRGASGQWCSPSRKARRAIREAMGVSQASRGRHSTQAVRVVREGVAERINGPGELVLEDGTALTVNKRLPRDLPIGYHDLHFAGRGGHVHLIVSPPACYLPEGLRIWGWAVQLYSLRSRRSWGMGDLADLRNFGRWAARQGARAVLINPLSAAAPVLPQQPSPYYPSSRIFRNPLFLRVEELPGAANGDPRVARLAAAGQALNAGRIIDRDAVFKLKMAACERLWQKTSPSAAFDGYRAEQGEDLERFAAYCALAERHGGHWHRWPASLRHPKSPAVARFARQRTDRIRFYQWLQWQLDVQLKKAAGAVGLINDLPVGIDPSGVDAWCWQDALAEAVKIGAPPDAFNPAGQDWGLQPFAPGKLREVGYRPFISSLRAAFRYARALRIDHVMGLFRLFWIPQGLSAREGCYVAYPHEDLLAIIAIESHRSKAFVIGEDLGTVETGVRRSLARHRVCGCRVMWFESVPPARYPALSLASVTTHDLPTIAGFWTGEDLKAQASLGFEVSPREARRMRDRLCRLLGLSPDADVDEAAARMHEALAESSSIVRLATLGDALGVTERPNMPGTTKQYPNWSLALPVTLEQLVRRASVSATSRAIGGGVWRHGADGL